MTSKLYDNCDYCGEYDRLTRDYGILVNLFPEVEPLPDESNKS